MQEPPGSEVSSGPLISSHAMENILIAVDKLSFREQLQLLELADGARDSDVRRHALNILTEYRQPPLSINVDITPAQEK